MASTDVWIRSKKKVGVGCPIYYYRPCPNCGGTGETKVRKLTCKRCKGEGRLYQKKEQAKRKSKRNH